MATSLIHKPIDAEGTSFPPRAASAERDGELELPSGPTPQEPHPQSSVGGLEANTPSAERSLQNPDLMAQGQMLNGRILLGLEERQSGSDETYEHGEH